MMKSLRPIYLICLIFIAYAVLGNRSAFSRSNPLSQGEETGKVTGVILDVNDARVVGARILINSGKVRRPEVQVTTDDTGRFEVNLPVGEYYFSVQAMGFCTFEVELLRVKANTTEAINIHLEVQGFDNWKLTDKYCRCSSRPTLKTEPIPKTPKA